MKPQENSSDNELLRLMQAGDENAFTLLYRRRHAGIYRFALQMCGSQAVADDVTQEVFLVLIRGSEIFDPSRGSLNAFLYGVARHQVLRRLRRERFYVPLESDDKSDEASVSTADEPLDRLFRTEAIEAVRKAVLSLPEHYREVVVLCDLEEMSYLEAAEVLGCAVGTVRSRLHRARSILIDKLRPLENAEADPAVTTARCFA